MKLIRKKTILIVISSIFLFFILAFIFIFCTDFIFSNDNNKLKKEILNKNVKFTENFFHSKECKLHYASIGDSSKQKLFFIHGTPGRWHNFLEFVNKKELWKKYNIILIDRPGNGKSSRISEINLKNNSKIIKEFINSYNDSSIILIGHSYGGAVVLRIGLEMEEKIKKIIIISGTISPDHTYKKWFNKFASLSFINKLISYTWYKANEEMTKLKFELIEHENKLKLFSKPIYVIQGENDFLVDYNSVNYLIKNVQKDMLKIEMIEDGNHFLIWNEIEKIYNFALKN